MRIKNPRLIPKAIHAYLNAPYGQKIDAVRKYAPLLGLRSSGQIYRFLHAYGAVSGRKHKPTARG